MVSIPFTVTLQQGWCLQYLRFLGVAWNWITQKLVIHLICNEHMNRCFSAALVMHGEVAQKLVVVRVLIGEQIV